MSKLDNDQKGTVVWIIVFIIILIFASTHHWDTSSTQGDYQDTCDNSRC